ncbi:MAG: hypothetical protein WCG97_02105 [bacterium]
MNPFDPQNNLNTMPHDDSHKETPESHGFDVLKKHLPLNRPPAHFESVDDKSRIEDLKKKLYSKSMTGIDKIRRPGLHEHSAMINESWAEEQKSTPKIEVFPNSARRRVFFKKFLTFSIFVFLIAVAYGAYQILSGNNFVSSANIDIKITGPVSVSSGDTLTLDVDVTNKNSGAIELADLVMTYPEGARKTSDNTQPQITDRISIGTINAGETKQERVQVVLFGEEGDAKNISAAVEYRIPGSISIFRKQKDVPMAIGNSPITLSIDTVNQVTAGQEVTLTLNIKSNSSQLLRGILVKGEFPSGFKFKSASPVPSYGIDTWNLGDIAPNSKQEIKIIGTMNSDENQERIFKFNAGTVDPKDENSIGTTFIASNASLTVKKPFIGSDIILDGKADKIVSVTAGDALQGEIVWQNNLDVPINDIVIEAKLNGNFLDRSSVKADPGFFRSSDNTMVWDKSTVSELSGLRPGGTGRVTFAFASPQPDKENVARVKNPAITVDLTVHGTRLNENAVSEDIQSVVTKTVKIQSELAMNTVLVRNVGPFQNTGPFPTVAEKASTFTANIQVSNSFNTVKDAMYKTTLPNYVEWTGKVSPSTAQVSYDPLTRTVSWNIGDVTSGTGYSSPAKSMYYQVSFKPSVSQVSTAPTVIKEQSVSGTDAFTGDVIKTTGPIMDIRLESDPTYQYEQDHVLAH